ncbi:MAG: hypothetical protein J6S14_18935 [Clostridia bacterium]|nr:hypothetical protein [Clostridia bacterium]
MNKRRMISIICIVLLLAMVAGLVLTLVPWNQGITEETNSKNDEEPNETINDTDHEGKLTETNPPELISPEEGHTSIPDLDEGNEIYLDMDVVAKLQSMEDAGREDEVNLILDTMLLLINEFADRNYSALAIAQIQRFYFDFREEIGTMAIDELCPKISDCIPASGIDRNEFADQVQGVFGFGMDKDFGYIYSAEAIE